jgi:hypothetical protein
VRSIVVVQFPLGQPSPSIALRQPRRDKEINAPRVTSVRAASSVRKMRAAILIRIRARRVRMVVAVVRVWERRHQRFRSKQFLHSCNRQARRKCHGPRRTSPLATSPAPMAMVRDRMRRDCGGVRGCNVSQRQRCNRLRYKTKPSTPLCAPNLTTQHRRSKRSSMWSRYSKKNEFRISPSHVTLVPIMQTWQFTP